MEDNNLYCIECYDTAKPSCIEHTNKQESCDLSNIFSKDQIRGLELLEELRIKGGYKTQKEALDAIIKWKKNKKEFS